MTTPNPLLVPSTLPYELPRFATLEFSHYREALDAGLAQRQAEVAAIAANPEPATFDNTILAMERSGAILNLAARVFFNVVASDSTEELRALETEYAPKLAADEDAVTLNAALYGRIKRVHDDLPTSGLDAEDAYLVERYFTEFSLRGAGLGDEDKARLTALNQRLSELQAEFGTRMLAETNDSAVAFAAPEELDGLNASELSACRAAAEARGLDGYLVTLNNTTTQPALAALTSRESRRRVLEAAMARGNRGNDFDTNALILQTVRLRAERAALLGYPTHAAAAVADQTARTPEAIEERVYPLAAPAARNARAEQAALQEYADRAQDAAGEPRFELAAWDWDFHAERVRAERYSVDTSQLKPFFEYDRVLRDGVFFAAHELYGLDFVEREDLVGYHPDARVFEVKDADGTGLGLFLHDVYTRDSKRGGAWMNNIIEQSTFLGSRPVICNNLNVPKPADGPTLLTLDEVGTMFHEFGHALHGLLANTRYPKLSGTNVSRDFVEFPSQVNEMWVDWPQVIEHYAVHHETGEPIDQAVLARLAESKLFNEGYETSAYLGSALLDQEWHKLAPGTEVVSVAAFEAAALERLGLDNPVVPPRYRTWYFGHTWGGGYDAGYYSYIWSEVLDADTVAWFKEHGGLTRANGDHFRGELLARGRSREPMESYRAFRGRDPEIRPLLERRGLVEGDA